MITVNIQSPDYAGQDQRYKCCLTGTLDAETLEKLPRAVAHKHEHILPILWSNADLSPASLT